MANLEAERRAIVEWLRVTLVNSAPNTLYHLLTAKPQSPPTDAVLMKHRKAVLIRYLPSLNHSLSQATGYLISKKIGELVTKHRSARLEAENLWRRKEDNG